MDQTEKDIIMARTWTFTGKSSVDGRAYGFETFDSGNQVALWFAGVDGVSRVLRLSLDDAGKFGSALCSTKDIA